MAAAPKPKKLTFGRPRKTCPKCGEDMVICKTAQGWKSFWLCEKCQEKLPKVKGDVEYYK